METKNKLVTLETLSISNDFIKQYIQSFTPTISGTVQNKSVPISSSAVRDMIIVGATYLNNKKNLTFGSSGTMFDTNPTKQIDCSSFVLACLQGIPYECSKYNGGNNDSVCGFSYIMPNITEYNKKYNTNRTRYYAADIAKYAYDNGFAFYPNSDYSNLSAGDIVFFDLNHRESFYQDKFLYIAHAGIVLGYKDKDHILVLHGNSTDVVGVYAISLKGDKTIAGNTNPYKNALVIAARFPLNESSGLYSENIIADGGTSYTSNGAALIHTYELKHNLRKNMPYTFICKFKNNTTVSGSYFGLRASYESGSDTTIETYDTRVFEEPINNVITLRFITGESEITSLKAYIMGDSATVPNASRKGEVEWCCLYEGSISPMPMYRK